MSRAALAAALLLAPATPAAGADFYVSKGGNNANPCTEASPCASVQSAVAKATVKDGDTIHIGPGLFAERVIVNKTLTLVGAGAGSAQAFDETKDTFIDASGVSEIAFDFTKGGTLRRLRARGGGGDSASQADHAIQLRASSSPTPILYTVEGVIGIGGSVGTTGRAGLIVTDTGVAGQAIEATISGDSYFTTPVSSLFSGSAVIVTGENASAAFRQTTLGPPLNGTGLSLQGKAAATFDDSTVLGFFDPSFGLIAGSGTELGIHRSTIHSGSIGVLSTNAATTLDDSLVIVTRSTGAYTGNAVRAGASGSGGVATVTARNSTLYSSAPGVVAAAAAVATGGSATVSLANTAVQAIDTDGTPGDTDLLADGAAGTTAAVTAASSAFSDRTETGTGTTTAPGSGANVTGDPLFGAPANENFVPGPGSPLIDRADAALLVAGATDLAGNARGVDGNADCSALPDIGAYEAPEMTRADCVPVPDTTAPTLAIAGSAVRLTKAGVLGMSVRCPATEPDPCAGTLNLRTVAKLRAGKGVPSAQLDLGTVTVGPLAPGATQPVAVTLLPEVQRAVRRRAALRVQASAALADPAGNAATVTRRFVLTTRPVLRIVSRALKLVDDGAIALRVRCPLREPGPCVGKLRLLPFGKGPALASGRLAPLARGQARTVRLALSSAAKATLGRRGSLRARVAATLTDAFGNTGTSRRVVAIRH